LRLLATALPKNIILSSIKVTLSMSRLMRLAIAVLVLGSAFRPAAAYIDRSESGSALPRQPLAAAVPALELRATEPPPPKPASPGQLFAHAIIVRTSPEQGGVAPETVGKVEVWYDAGIRDDFVALAVINAAGDRVDKHDAAIDRFDQSHVSASVEALTPGEYTVRYRAMSADGHLVSGAWLFEVRPE
jgi:copper resistance protein C